MYTENLSSGGCFSLEKNRGPPRDLGASSNLLQTRLVGRFVGYGPFHEERRVLAEDHHEQETADDREGSRRETCRACAFSFIFVFIFSFSFEREASDRRGARAQQVALGRVEAELQETQAARINGTSTEPQRNLNGISTVSQRNLSGCERGRAALAPR